MFVVPLAYPDCKTDLPKGKAGRQPGRVSETLATMNGADANLLAGIRDGSSLHVTA
jgi:hypothetical protein